MQFKQKEVPVLLIEIPTDYLVHNELRKYHNLNEYPFHFLYIKRFTILRCFFLDSIKHRGKTGSMDRLKKNFYVSLANADLF